MCVRAKNEIGFKINFRLNFDKFFSATVSHVDKFEYVRLCFVQFCILFRLPLLSSIITDPNSYRFCLLKSLGSCAGITFVAYVDPFRLCCTRFKWLLSFASSLLPA